MDNSYGKLLSKGHRKTINLSYNSTKSNELKMKLFVIRLFRGATERVHHRRRYH